MLKKLANALPDLKESWLIFFLLLLGQLSVSVLETAVFSLVGPDAGSRLRVELQQVLMPVVYAAGYVFPLMYIYWMGLRRGDSAHAGFDRPRFGKMGAWVFIPLAVLMECALVVLLESIPPIGRMPEWMKEALESVMNSGLFYNLLTVSVLAPVLEEFVFRGVILRGLLQKMRPVWAVFWSSALFALAHMNPWQAVPAFVIGCLLGWLYYRSGSYWTVVLLHALNNAATVVVSSVAGLDVAGEESLLSMVGQQAAYLMAVLSIIVLVAGIALINKYLPKNNNSISI